MKFLDLTHVTKKLNVFNVFIKGILQLKSTEIGCITINSKQLLEDGIRRELVKQIAAALHTQLQFTGGKISGELMVRLEKLGEQLDGFRRSFEYIQDYANLYGLKIWQEEFSRIVYFYVEQECNTFSKKKIFEYESMYQSKNIPIPVYAPLPPVSANMESSVNLIGRLAREILRVTDPRTAYYVEKKSAWFDLKTREELVNMRLFKKLEVSLNSFGLHGLDRLYSFIIAKQLEIVVNSLKKNEKAIEDIFRASIAQFLPLDTNSSKKKKF